VLGPESRGETAFSPSDFLIWPDRKGNRNNQEEPDLTVLPDGGRVCFAGGWSEVKRLLRTSQIRAVGARVPRLHSQGAIRREHANQSRSAWTWSNETSHGLVLNRASMLIDAAVDGQGVALARTALAAWDLINGRLARPFDLPLKLSKSYWIVCPKATSTKPKIVTFRDWLLAEAADDARRLRKMFASKL
jgi:DNA-binding transcriptional LysR family regulator